MTFKENIKIYADSRMAKILLLGFISGFPWLLTTSMLSLWLKDEGLSRTGITLFALVGTVYAFNALWAPLIDSVKVPLLEKFLGRRISWIVIMQSIIAISMLFLFFLPSASNNLPLIALIIFIIALASATQDIAIDATRISLIGRNEPEKIGPGAAMATSGWWLGFGGSKAIALPLIQLLEENQNLNIDNPWQSGYFALIAVILLSITLLIIFKPKQNYQSENNSPPSTPGSPDKPLTLFLNLYLRPIQSFVGLYSLKIALKLLFFIFFFKIGEAFLGKTSILFYNEIGFSKSEIGLLSGGLGAITVCLFAILGSFINARYGLFRGILLGGIAMASTNLLFSLLAIFPEKHIFIFAVVTDQFTTAISTVAFVAFISQLCDRAHAGTQYAALSSLGNLSRTTLAAGSGWMVDAMDGNWFLFFIITVFMVTPSLIILITNRKTISPIMQGATTKLL